MKKSTTRNLDPAVCVCGHWVDDHHCDAISYTAGRITLGACLDTTCPYTAYSRKTATQGA